MKMRDEHLGRLRAMATPGQQTWDLSPNDQAGIAWAVRVIETLPALLDCLDEPCRLDHHGNCQEHFVQNPCSVDAVRRALAD